MAAFNDGTDMRCVTPAEADVVSSYGAETGLGWGSMPRVLVKVKPFSYFNYILNLKRIG